MVRQAHHDGILSSSRESSFDKLRKILLETILEVLCNTLAAGKNTLLLRVFRSFNADSRAIAFECG
jgi:hypothetical protein